MIDGRTCTAERPVSVNATKSYQLTIGRRILSFVVGGIRGRARNNNSPYIKDIGLLIWFNPEGVGVKINIRPIDGSFQKKLSPELPFIRAAG
jgi:hypothetical protein